MDNLNYIVESLIFVSKNPLSFEQLKKMLPEVNAKEIRTALTHLITSYEERNCSIYIKEVANGYQFRTRPEYRDWIKRLVKSNPVRLSKAALETLAIVAYRQPIIRNDIEHIRGVDSGGVLRQLLEKNLIRVVGRKEVPGRPLIYTTTRQFLELFELKDLKDLPTPKEIDEIEMTQADTENVPQEETLPQSEQQDEDDLITLDSIISSNSASSET